MYQKKNLTPAQRSENARKAQAARKNRKGGRPKGSTKTQDGTKTAKVMRSIGVYEEDYKTFRRLADYGGQTLADTMHRIAESRKKDNPKVFAETGVNF